MSPAASLAAITDHQARLRALLERYEPGILATRPPSGDWSAIENVRHLITTAQHHLGPFVPGGLGWSQLGLPQGTHPDTNATTDVAAVLHEWDRVYAAAIHGLDLTNAELAVEVPRRGVRVLSFQLGRFLRHQEAHGRSAARALSDVTGQVVRVPRASRNGSRHSRSGDELLTEREMTQSTISSKEGS